MGVRFPLKVCVCVCCDSEYKGGGVSTNRRMSTGIFCSTRPHVVRDHVYCERWHLMNSSATICGIVSGIRLSEVPGVLPGSKFSDPGFRSPLKEKFKIPQKGAN